MKILTTNFTTQISFNPSFTGIALVANSGPSVGCVFTSFQSFFYWNCLGGIAKTTSRPPLLTRFNPSFTGIALVAAMRSAGASRYFKFQSFFYWNCLGGTG